MEMLGGWREHYDRAAFVDMEVAPNPGTAEARAREEAIARGWEYERIAGELDIVRRLIDGGWSESDFLIVNPGNQVAMSYDDDVVKAVAS